jgi:hypothetical protein
MGQLESEKVAVKEIVDANATGVLMVLNPGLDILCEPLNRKVNFRFGHMNMYELLARY